MARPESQGQSCLLWRYGARHRRVKARFRSLVQPGGYPLIGSACALVCVYSVACNWQRSSAVVPPLHAGASYWRKLTSPRPSATWAAGSEHGGRGGSGHGPRCGGFRVEGAAGGSRGRNVWVGREKADRSLQHGFGGVPRGSGSHGDPGSPRFSAIAVWRASHPVSGASVDPLCPQRWSGASVPRYFSRRWPSCWDCRSGGRPRRPTGHRCLTPRSVG